MPLNLRQRSCRSRNRAPSGRRYFLLPSSWCGREGQSSISRAATPSAAVASIRIWFSRSSAQVAGRAYCRIAGPCARHAIHPFPARPAPPAAPASHLDEASVTSTENAIIAAAGAKGETVIANAASEPHVQGLCRFLTAWAGLRSEGIGSNLLTIRGTNDLVSVNHAVGGDYIEAGSFIGLAAATRSGITVEGVDVGQLRMIRYEFERIGVRIEVDAERNALMVPERQSLKVQKDLGGAVPRIQDSPWPGFPSDLLSILLVVATSRKAPASSTRRCSIPPLFRRQARLDGRIDRAVRSAPGSPRPVRRCSTAPPLTLRTSAPAWRCLSPRSPAEAAEAPFTISSRSTAATSRSMRASQNSARQSSG